MYIWFEWTRLSYLFVESNIFGIIILVQMIKNEIETFFFMVWNELNALTLSRLSYLLEEYNKVRVITLVQIIKIEILTFCYYFKWI